MMVLYEKIKNLLDHGSISMHVPGHKNNTIGSLSKFDWRYDMTEIEGLDDLHEPEGVLAALNGEIGAKYEGYTAQMMVNGTTNGILAAIHALAKDHGRFIVLEGAHKSIHHALELAGKEHVALPLDELMAFDFIRGDIAVVTYPSYTGECFDISALISKAHAGGALVLTDEAHGAHFDIAPGFPDSSMRHGSDVTVQSYHKMLPALTMASVIFTRDRTLHGKIMKYVDYFGTSSPSYLVMLSIEAAHQFYLSYDREVFFRKRDRIISALEDRGIHVARQDDPAKIMLSRPDMTPYALSDAFIHQYVHPEMATDEGVLFCLPLFHEGDAYPFDVLLERIEAMDMSYRRSKAAEVPLHILEGRVCMRTIVPYPPGVPLVREGERITRVHVKSMAHYLKNHVRIEGINHNLKHYRNGDN